MDRYGIETSAVFYAEISKVSGKSVEDLIEHFFYAPKKKDPTMNPPKLTARNLILWAFYKHIAFSKLIEYSYKGVQYRLNYRSRTFIELDAKKEVMGYFFARATRES